MAKGTELLTVNRRLELRRPGERTVYRTLIQKVGDEYFAVQLPMVRGIEVPLHQGEQVEVHIVAGDGRYVFTTEVLGRDWDRIPLYRLAKPKEVRREQLREYVRWRVALEVRYEPVSTADLKELHLYRPRREAVSIDLGGGGLQMLTKEPLMPGTLLLLQFEIPVRQGQEVIAAVGRVRRLVPYEREGPPRFAVGVSFEQISERDRELIISFLFRRMVAERQRVPEDETVPET
ncbi:MAG: flagellar brake domain-containing protein [Clostridia bacterium]|nr:flagellar brake domain-containing protein [Clostridia bacterium]